MNLIAEKHMTTCPCCGNSNFSSKYKIREWDIGCCSQCSFARIDPLPSRISRPEFYKKEGVVMRNEIKIKSHYSLSRRFKRFYKDTFGRNRNDIFSDKLCRYLPQGSKILDVGCGEGAFLNSIKDRFSCSGIEISDYLADRAKNQGGLDIKIGDFQTFDFQNEKFDGITMISVIEHVDDPYRTIKKCFDLLNPNGVLILKTVNYSCLNRMLVREKWTGFRPPDHIVYFSPTNLLKMLDRIGFKKLKTTSWPFNDNMYLDIRKASS